METQNPTLARNIRIDISKWLSEQTDPVSACLAHGWMIEQLQHNIELLSTQRMALARTLRADGMSIRKIASALGISSTRVEQLTR